MTSFNLSLTVTPLWEILLRMSLAVLFGGILGLDRELKGSEAGLKTHSMTSLAAAIFTILTLEIWYQTRAVGVPGGPDPLRIIDAVTAGVAFLAAGAIINAQGQVRGLTTGAGMWLAGAVGLACGSGHFIIALFGVVLAIFVFRGLRLFERHVLKRRKPPAEGS